jgi:rod shape-determining protein MreC
MALYRRARSTRLLVVSLVMASLITISVDYRGGQSGPLETFGSKLELTVIGPLQGAVSKVFHPVAAFFGGLVHIGSLASENRNLRAENERLRTQVAQSVTTQRELRRLQKLAGLGHQLGLTGVTASVVGESLSNFEWSVTINRGSSSGVRVNMPVISGEGLVGRVEQVAANWSTVMLIIDPRSSVAGRLTSSGETGLVTGERNRPLVMDLVNPGTTVAPQEQVITSGYEGGVYPPGILIGVVTSEYSRPGSLTKSVLVAPAVDFSSLEFVEVITGSQTTTKTTHGGKG